MANAPAFVIDTFGFRVPCRLFYVKANVTRDRNLPIVDEYVLRLLRICEGMELDDLGKFFGFQRAEIEMVVGGLDHSGLARFDGGKVVLTPTAIGLFENNPEGEPRLISVESWDEHLWVELVTRSLVPEPQSGGQSKYLIGIGSELPKMDESVARDAMSKGFAGHIRRKGLNPQRISHHSTSAAEPGRVMPALVRASKVIPDGQVEPVLEFGREWSDWTEDGLSLKGEIASEYGRLQHARGRMNAFEEFRVLTGDDHLVQYMHDNGEFNLARLIEDTVTPASGSRRGYLIGAAYLERNRRELWNFVNTHLAAASVAPEIWWRRPMGDAWGRTPDLAETVQYLENLIRSTFKQQPRTTLFVPASVRQARRHDRVFLRGVANIEDGNHSQAIEIVCVPDVAALVIVHLTVGQDSVPLGVLVPPGRHLQAVQRRFREGNEIWNSSAQQAKSRRLPEVPKE